MQYQLAWFAVLCFSFSIQASEQNTSQLSIPNLDNHVSIDGVYSEDEWTNAAETNLNFVTRPFENTAPPVRTQVKFFENGTELLVVFIAKDPNPQAIRAFLRDRDTNAGGEFVGVKLDTYNDGRLAYQFFVNPLGVQTDSIENEMTGSESSSWNGIWDSAGQLTSDGYVVEMRIPLRLMNFQESNEIKTWGVEFVRFYPRVDNYRISQVPFDRDNSCNLCQMGSVSGFKDAKQGANLVLAPTVVAGVNRNRDVFGDREWDYQRNQEVGLDINWGITPELTFSGTLNPDFSQVEADQAQLNINNNFALFNDEQRPFFVENEEYFSSLQNLVYTRNINAPDYGAKLTGRVENHSIGVFVANDVSTSFLVPGNLGSSVATLKQDSVNFAGRYRYDYSDDVSLGLVTTVRDSDDYRNIVNGVDTRLRISEQDTVRAQIVHSATDYAPDLFERFCNRDCSQESDFTEAALRTQTQDTIKGLSYRLQYERDTRNYFLNARREVTEADFRGDLGFISNVDRQLYVFGGGYRWWNEDSWWNRIQINGDWDITHNDQGELIEKELEAEFNITGDLQSYFEIGYDQRTRVGLRENRASLAIDGNTTQFEERSASAYFEMQPNGLIEFYGFLRVGDRVDLVNNRLGDQVYAEQGVDLNIGTHLRVSLDHTYSELDSAEQPLFIANLLDTRITYQFDPRQFLRLILAYSDIQRNADNYAIDVQSKSRDLGFQLLYSYKLNPLTKFFVGYSQSAFDNDNLEELVADNQSVFMKFSYGWLP
ncbi:carbohydrate binding family 9 domain-containing protein [Glaciecola sp. XM2]|uniref:carbohydrate binding family 9 domain-containing protein n=1 Tax=Glaciecola sp. XM2 TaxID=1914931 RepID=UPI001BDE1EA9|nr:carbohydrate binding family 9 domain-containing protein [Glaciecola sp. XM2]MBT1451227.1 carbohydrate binding family 9 domain-containing protein [Glaciecola sp. XM2]